MHAPFCGSLCKTCSVLHRRSPTTKGCISFQTNSSPGRILGLLAIGHLCTQSLLEGLAKELASSKTTCLSPKGYAAVPGLQMGFPEQFNSFSPLPQVQRSPFKALLPGPAGPGHLDQARQQQEFLWQRKSPRMTN